MDRRELRNLRPRMQMIFQDPESSLNPKMRIGESIAEPFRQGLRGKMSRREIQDNIMDLIDIVGLNPEHVNRFPYQLSGGQDARHFTFNWLKESLHATFLRSGWPSR